MKTMKFRQDRVVSFFREAYQNDADRVMAESAIVDLVRQKQISALKGADILGMHLADFVHLMAQRGVSYFSEPLQDADAVLARYQSAQET